MWLTLLIVIFQPQQKKSSPYHYYFSKARYFPDFAFTLQPQLVLFFPFNKINIKMKRYNNYEKQSWRIQLSTWNVITTTIRLNLLQQRTVTTKLHLSKTMMFPPIDVEKCMIRFQINCINHFCGRRITFEGSLYHLVEVEEPNFSDKFINKNITTSQNNSPFLYSSLKLEKWKQQAYVPSQLQFIYLKSKKV